MVSVVRVGSHTLYCGRTGRGESGHWGNYTSAGTARSYWLWLIQPEQLAYRNRFFATVQPHDKLGCFCKPKPCHADALAIYANARLDGHSDTDACIAVQSLMQ
jgi:hypothetical protein